MRILDRADELRSSRTPFTLATVVRARRPTSAHTGDRALILPDGTIEGFVGGACAETTVRVQGLRALTSGVSTLLRITPEPDAPVSALNPGGTTTAGQGSGERPAGTMHEASWCSQDSRPKSAEAEAEDDGVVVVANPCLSGGMLEIFLEAVVPPPLVCVHGDGPVARALAEVGAALGYDVRATGDLPDGGVTAVVVAAHGRDEERVLTAALRAGVPYVGLVASVRRGAAVVAGLDEPDAERIRTPAGLDIGARTPPEIALSVFAQVIAERPASHAAPVAAPGPAEDAAATVTDPVCGMDVAAGTGPWAAHAGRVWRFCGTGCRDAFAADPVRYTM